MIENAPWTAVRTIWAPLILHDLLMSRRGVPSRHDVWGCTGGAARAEPLLSAPPPFASARFPCSLSQSHAQLRGGGTVLSLRLLWSLFVPPGCFHTFYVCFFFFSLVYRKYAGLSRFYLSSSPRIFFFFSGGTEEIFVSHQYLYTHRISL